MPRDLISSQASYATFKQAAYPVLQHYAPRSVGTKAKRLYSLCYARHVHPDAQPKTALENADLLRAMCDLTVGLGNRVAKIQGKGTMNVNACANDFGRMLSGEPHVPSQHTLDSMRGYLHVYALNGREENNNWRIGANVVPASIPEMLRRAGQILDAHANAGHFKVTPPGAAGKPDSFILYMNRDGNYAATLGAVTVAAGDLEIQESFTPMWNEVAAGIAEAAEPPKVAYGPEENQRTTSLSFGSYRCLLTAMAFEQARPNPNQDPQRDAFEAAMDTVFNRYGVPVDNPHRQLRIEVGQAPQQPAANTVYIDADQQNAYLRALASYKGRDNDYYINRNGVIANRPPVA